MSTEKTLPRPVSDVAAWRASDARAECMKHERAADNWTAVAKSESDPRARRVYELLAEWMRARAENDSAFEQRFLALKLDLENGSTP